MCDIKFRAWDTVNKRFIHVSLGDLVCGACTNDGDKPLSGYKQVWEQFAGLKDKNGKEIYEGDIVEAKHSDWIEPTICVVKWCGDEKYPAFNLKPELDEVVNSIALVAQSDFFSVKVVGNIHENPELLEEK